MRVSKTAPSSIIAHVHSAWPLLELLDGVNLDRFVAAMCNGVQISPASSSSPSSTLTERKERKSPSREFGNQFS